MADSSITKRALSLALKELMQEKPFQKISVADICEKCSMNRQSFYYHFKDKYELVIWVFDMELLELIQQRQVSDEPLGIILQICEIIYENRVFYRSAFAVQGQNSLSDHVREITAPMLQVRLRKALPNGEISSFILNFISDALLAALMRWIGEEECLPPNVFIKQLYTCIYGMAEYVTNTYPKE